MLQWEHSAILLTFIKLPFVTKIFVLSIFEWPLKTGFTVYIGSCMSAHVLLNLLNKLKESDIMQGLNIFKELRKSDNVRFVKHFITFSQRV